MSSRASLFLVVIIGAATPQMQAALPSTPTVAAWITPRGGGRTAPSSSSSTSYPAPHPLPSTGLISQPAPRQEAPLSEMTLLSWRNHHTTDIFAEKGSAHIESLCKWGPSTLTVRKRVLPSGRPKESLDTLEQPDPTWDMEYAHFKRLCGTGAGNIDNDLWLNRQLKDLADEALSRFPPPPATTA